MTQPKTPNSRRNLDLAIDRLCAKTGDEPGRVKRLLATAIVGQMLPDGAAKGGNALKIRFGKDSTRFSRDLDTTRASSLPNCSMSRCLHQTRSMPRFSKISHVRFPSRSESAF